MICQLEKQTNKNAPSKLFSPSTMNVNVSATSWCFYHMLLSSSNVFRIHKQSYNHDI